MAHRATPSPERRRRASFAPTRASHDAPPRQPPTFRPVELLREEHRGEQPEARQQRAHTGLAGGVRPFDVGERRPRQRVELAELAKELTARGIAPAGRGTFGTARDPLCDWTREAAGLGMRCASTRCASATLGNAAVERRESCQRTRSPQEKSPRRERRGLTTEGRASCYGSPISLAFSWVRIVAASSGSSRPSSSCSWSARVTAAMYPAFDP
jgi:hypothetical protein